MGCRTGIDVPTILVLNVVYLLGDHTSKIVLFPPIINLGNVGNMFLLLVDLQLAAVFRCVPMFSTVEAITIKLLDWLLPFVLIVGTWASSFDRETDLLQQIGLSIDQAFWFMIILAQFHNQVFKSHILLLVFEPKTKGKRRKHKNVAATSTKKSKGADGEGTSNGSGKGTGKGAAKVTGKGAGKGAAKGVAKGDGKRAGKGVGQGGGKGKGKQKA
ncbi:hypothetical protein OROHE_025867 [Orobanche hederae]